MKKLLLPLLGVLAVFASSFSSAYAGNVKAAIVEFKVTGAANKDDLKGALPSLLASRLSSSGIAVIDSTSGADGLLYGTYVAFGKVFSIDVVTKDRSGRVVGRDFEQGDAADDVLPALARLAGKVAKTLEQIPALPPAPVASPERAAAVAGDVVRPAQPVPAPKPTAVESDIIKAPPTDVKAAGDRMRGVMTMMAPWENDASGTRQFLVADGLTVRIYRQGEGKPIAEATLSPDNKILSVDAFDLDGNGHPEAYVTVFSSDELSSQVWELRGAKLVQTANKLPYYFRVISLAGAAPKLFAQKMGRDEEFYGDVFEVEKKGTSYELVRPLKLPRFANIYNFNVFADAKNARYTVVLNEHGRLIVYGADGEELWRSSDKFGGSEVFIRRRDLSQVVATGESYRSQFLEQRIVVAPDGSVIVPQNGGLFVVGNSRSYDRSTVFCFGWNGSSLEEKWHTKPAKQYLADFFYDAKAKELVSLEVTSRSGLFSAGGSAFVVRKVD